MARRTKRPTPLYQAQVESLKRRPGSELIKAGDKRLRSKLKKPPSKKKLYIARSKAFRHAKRAGIRRWINRNPELSVEAIQKRLAKEDAAVAAAAAARRAREAELEAQRASSGKPIAPRHHHGKTAVVDADGIVVTIRRDQT